MTMHYDADLLGDYLHGELTPEEDAAVHAHLEACGSCRLLHDDVIRLREWTRAAARAEERELPAGVTAAVWAAVRAQERAPLLERLRAAWRPRIALPIGALALAAAVVLALPVLQPASAPVRVAATYYFEEHAAQTAGNPLADRSEITTMSALTQAVPVVDAVDAGAPDAAGAAR